MTKCVPYDGLYCDERITGFPKYYLGGKPVDADMRVSEDYLESVCFICVKVPLENENYRLEFAGTGFIVSFPTRFQTVRMTCFVTAKHVIQNIRKAGYTEIFVRINTEHGQSVVTELKGEWHYSDNPAVDVAVTFPGFPIVPGLKVHSVALENFATDEKIKQESIGIGDDVFAIGLFTHKSGNERNTPIMRTGIIASMPDEPLETGEDDELPGICKIYLVELRSIGGISGSPVFVHLDFWRLGPNMFEKRIDIGGLTIQRKTFLLGLIRGHWNLERRVVAHDHVPPATEDEEIEKLNTGIAMVTPIKDVLDIINGEAMMKKRLEVEKDYISQHKPTYDESTPAKPKRRAKKPRK
jgi:hypothetical protein